MLPVTCAAKIRDPAAARAVLTLAVAVRLPVQRKLAGIIQHHELPQQALNDLSGGGLRADVELLHAVAWEIEGCSLLRRPAVCRLLLLRWCSEAAAGL